ncbi:MAG: SANT/Myb domain-containing protein, partial [Desulfobacterales bacterium]|nr:SANT/Myb domain-containing protein [Desulfobacterales bacterium]
VRTLTFHPSVPFEERLETSKQRAIWTTEEIDDLEDAVGFTKEEDVNWVKIAVKKIKSKLPVECEKKYKSIRQGFARMGKDKDERRVRMRRYPLVPSSDEDIDAEPSGRRGKGFSWSNAETRKLMALVRKKGKNWPEISKDMRRRSSEACATKWRREESRRELEPADIQMGSKRSGSSAGGSSEEDGEELSDSDMEEMDPRRNSVEESEDDERETGRRRWTNDEVTKLLRLRSKGKSRAEISEALHRSIS